MENRAWTRKTRANGCMEPSFPAAKLARWPPTVGLRELCGMAENRNQGTLITQCSCLGRELSPPGEESADTVGF